MSDEHYVPFDDRGLAYGDGLFETVLLYAGAPVLWRYHMARLTEGCDRLGIPLPSQEALDATWQGDPRAEFEVLKLILTRGSGGRGYAQPEQMVPRLLSRRTPFQPSVERWQSGVTIRICDLRLARQPRLAGIKHLNRLENVLARQEWNDAAIAEGVLADSEDLVVEATSMNIFWHQAGQVLTPTLDQCGVAGTLRAALLEQGGVVQATLSLHQLADVERLWVANSVQGVWPVTKLLAADGSLLQRWPLDQPDPFQRLAHQLLGVA
ncbi:MULTISPECIES: aminodeoxychorismate lyase [unclassified Halomonas]|uniref:aminodeoxychorismate lyase n=1 Tax=unclassified Halomonas TaxID=2609666 RepID=UPI0007D9FAA3|nr:MULTISPECIES: aminodeoxychorismate lyase [unclassified Halomonas]OAL57750.1 aminodeoxychorismate lyase [Halomonas sp. ALS9]